MRAEGVLARGTRFAGAVLAVAALAAAALAPAALAPAAGARGGTADFGDAPDGAPAGYRSKPAVRGRFPTLAASRGPRHLELGPLKLGFRVDGEPDGTPRDGDRYDDGASAKLRRCRTSRLTVVLDTRALPAGRRAGAVAYVNAWFDWNRDGDWADGSDGCAREWAVENLPVRLEGTRGIIVLPITLRAGRQVRELWSRVSVTLDEPAVDPTGAAGAAPYTLGETEDRLLRQLPSVGLAFPSSGARRGPATTGSGRFTASCTPDPAAVAARGAVAVAFGVEDAGRGLIAATLRSRSRTRRYAIRLLRDRTRPARRGRLLARGFELRSRVSDRLAGVEAVRVALRLRRGAQVQDLRCTVLVVHPGRGGAPPLRPIPCVGLCAGAPAPKLPPLAGLAASWRRESAQVAGKPTEVLTVRLNATARLPATVDGLRIPLAGQRPPWSTVSLIRFGPLGDGSCAVAAPEAGPPSLVCARPPRVASDQPDEFLFLAPSAFPDPTANVDGVLTSGGRPIGSFSALTAAATLTTSPLLADGVEFAVAITQPATGFEIRFQRERIAGDIPPPGLACEVRTTELPNDTYRCTGDIAAGTAVKGVLGVLLPIGSETDALLTVFQGELPIGPLPVRGPVAPS